MSKHHLLILDNKAKSKNERKKEKKKRKKKTDRKIDRIDYTFLSHAV